MRRWLALVMVMFFISSCSSMKPEVIPSPIPAESGSTEIAEESLIATEQFMAGVVKTQAASTRVAQATFTPGPTLTSPVANLPTLTPIPNSTPAQIGAFFDVSPDELGPRYEIDNACYFDTQSGWERYEIYAGAVSGSGDEYSAQGAVVIRHLRVVEQAGKAQVELVDTKELLTLKKLGPLRLPAFGNCGGDRILLTTPLNFGWFLEPGGSEFYQYEGIVPYARLEVGDKTQLSEVGSYCWKGGCADGPVIPTPSTPLVVASSQPARLFLPLEEPPNGLTISAMLVSPLGALQGDAKYDYVGKDTASWSYEKPERELLELGELPLRREQEIKLFLKPGYYALTVSAVWRDYGDVKYGFLVKVRES